MVRIILTDKAMLAAVWGLIFLVIGLACGGYVLFQAVRKH